VNATNSAFIRARGCVVVAALFTVHAMILGARRRFYWLVITEGDPVKHDTELRGKFKDLKADLGLPLFQEQ